MCAVYFCRSHINLYIVYCLVNFSIYRCDCDLLVARTLFRLTFVSFILLTRYISRRATCDYLLSINAWISSFFLFGVTSMVFFFLYFFFFFSIFSHVSSLTYLYLFGMLFLHFRYTTDKTFSHLNVCTFRNAIQNCIGLLLLLFTVSVSAVNLVYFIFVFENVSFIT